MNRTKKRAQKRSLKRKRVMKILKRIRTKCVTPSKFKWPHPLTQEFRIKNCLAYRTFHSVSLSEARDAVDSSMPCWERPRPSLETDMIF